MRRWSILEAKRGACKSKVEKDVVGDAKMVHPRGCEDGNSGFVLRMRDDQTGGGWEEGIHCRQRHTF